MYCQVWYIIFNTIRKKEHFNRFRIQAHLYSLFAPGTDLSSCSDSNVYTSP